MPPRLVLLTIAGRPGGIVVSSIDCKEGLQDTAAQDALRSFGRLVGHEAVDESESSLGNGDTGERLVDEERILVDALLVAGTAKLAKYLKIVVAGIGVWLKSGKL